AVTPTRIIGKAKLFKLNTNDPTIKKLVKLHWEIIKEETNKAMKEEVAVH
ncbi:hypothetical protein HZA99_06295, partial [Candidatus Woesearchaeota archaeon]|nr:hypothetical protein [Candidatus Woesearchaeota archaeon]